MSNSPNQRVNLHAIHIVQFLQRLLDLPLVCLDIANEHKCIILLNLLHCALRIERVDDHFVMVEAGLMRDGLSRIFRRSRKLEGFGPVKCRGEAYFADLM